MTVTMTHRQRIEAAVRGERPDRIPIALWRHFPYVDQTAEGLARAVIDFQEAYDFDLVKVTHTSGYPAEAWGAELEHADNEEGTRHYLKRRVTGPGDWHSLEPLEFDRGVLARELHALELIRQELGADVHVLPTIFNPLTIAKQLAGDEALLDHLRHHPDDLEVGLGTIRDFAARFSLACLEHGADAIFFATQFASRDRLTDEEYRRFGVPFDMPVVDTMRPHTDLILLHLHGTNPMFELANEYGVEVVNWHDRETSPSLAEGLARFRKGAALGGLLRTDLVDGTREGVAAQARDAIEQTGGQRLIVGVGCVTLTTTPPANIAAARDAVLGHGREQG